MLNQLNRLMAIFLRTYGGYTRETMMEEYAITVITLINEAVKLDAQDKLEGIQNNAIVHLERRDATKIINHYQRILEDHKPVDTKAGIEMLRELMK